MANRNKKEEVSKVVDDDRFNESDFDESDDENEGKQVFVQKKSTVDRFRDEEEEDDDDEEIEEEEEQDDDEEGEEEEDQFDDDEEEDENSEIEGFGDEVPQIKSKSKDSQLNKKLKKLTPEQLQKEEKRIKKTGVCYLSRVPPYMKPSTLRSILSRFGKIDRLFLKPEDAAIHHKRVKYGGNKKKNFTEGWIEFVSKKDAKMCASTLNGNKLGGKKTSYYYDDVINIKYLSGFKWFDLTQQIAKENEVRQARLALELSQQQKLNKSFVNNVEKSKMISNIQRKRKEKEIERGDEAERGEEEIRRSFKQRKVSSKRADADTSIKDDAKPSDRLNSVLSKVF